MYILGLRQEAQSPGPLPLEMRLKRLHHLPRLISPTVNIPLVLS
jgi:hypothetical protein